jgi:S-DNA-T family DNA segregation ATPase FtsK/SpoIIIE
MIFDVSVQDLFRWSTPSSYIRESVANIEENSKPFLPKTQKCVQWIHAIEPSRAGSHKRSSGQAGHDSQAAETVIQWKLPDIKTSLIQAQRPVNEEFIQQRARLIAETLASFGAPVQVVEINRGPTITQFGVEPLFVETRTGRTKVRVNKIASLADDLALALAAPRIRIQAPVPGHSYVGIEVPNDEMTLVVRDLLETDIFQHNKTHRFA